MTRLIIDLDKIRNNAGAMVWLAGNYGISLTGVTKGCCGDAAIARAMIEGGVTSIADSKIENIKKLEHIDIEKILMVTSPSNAEEAVRYADISVNTELDTIRLLSKYACKAKKAHKILLMVEMGDLREGINPKELSSFIKSAELPFIEICGLGMNLACLYNAVPSVEVMNKFEDLISNYDYDIFSGGSTKNTPLLMDGMIHGKINNMRTGNSILNGVTHTDLDILHDDAIVLEAEVIEVRKKNGIDRAVLALGHHDTRIEHVLTNKIIEYSEDHCIIYNNDYNVGDMVRFKIDYFAMLQSFTSPYVERIYR